MTPAVHEATTCRTCDEWRMRPGSLLHQHQIVPHEVEAGVNPKDLLGVKKPPLRLIPAAALLFCSKVMALGAKKYGAYNWRSRKVKRTVYLEAAMRHVLSVLDGEDCDPESGQPHEAHAMACMAILLDAKATGNLVDDRPIAGAAARLIVELTEK
jgi:hypothetical protein